MPSPDQLAEAIARLELLAEPATQWILHTLEQEGHAHLPDLSRMHQMPPSRMRKRLQQLKRMNLVFSPKRFPQGYAVNQFRWLKLRLGVRLLVVGVQTEE